MSGTLTSSLPRGPARGFAALAGALLLVLLAPAAPARGATAFADGFESGSLAAWSQVSAASGGSAFAQTQHVRSGAYGARMWASSSAGSHAYARRSLSAPASALTFAADVRIHAGGSAGNVPLLRVFDGAGNRLVSVYRQNNDADRLYVQHSGRYNTTSGTLAFNTWGRVELTISSSSALTVRLNGNVIHDTTAAALGGAGAQIVQIGNDTAAQPFDLVVDNVAVSTPDVTAPPAAGGCNAATPAPWSADPGSVVVADNFESGLGRWSVTQQGDAHVTTQTQVVRSGGCAARVAVTANSGSLGNLSRWLPAYTRELWAEGWFHFEAQGVSTTWNTPTFRMFSNGQRVLDVSRQNGSGDLFVRWPNGAGGWTIRSTGRWPALRRWYHVRIHAYANWSQSTVEVWLDGSRIFATTAATLGTGTLSMQMVGAEHARQEGVVAVDDVLVKARG